MGGEALAKSTENVNVKHEVWLVGGVAGDWGHDLEIAQQGEKSYVPFFRHAESEKMCAFSIK